MAEKGGRFNRFLNAIGFVEVNEPTQANGGDYGDDYVADDYRAPQSYAPPRSRSGQAMPRTGGARQPQPTASRSSIFPSRASASGARPGASAGSRATSGTRAPQSGRSNPAGTRRPSDAGRTGTGTPYDYSPRPPQSAESSAQRAPRSAPRTRTVMLSLQELTDCCDVIDNLIMNNTVVLTMDDMDRTVMQRAIDTLSGAVFALHATFRRASEHTFLIAPSGVEVNDLYDPDSRF